MALALRLRLVPTLAAAAMIALTVALGNWQSGRAREKEALQQRLDAVSREAPVHLGAAAADAAALDLRRVVGRGEWQPERMVLHDNRTRRGQPGYHVLMPLKLEGGNMHVLVNRGWVAAARDRSVLPQIATPDGTVGVEGIARVPGDKVFELAREAQPGRVWQNVTLQRFRDWSGLQLQPVVLQQTNDASDGLVREWDRPDLGIDKHRGYALQWYSLAGLTAVLLLVLSLKRESGEAGLT
jgi:surfeit locus 1 family protein